MTNTLRIPSDHLLAQHSLSCSTDEAAVILRRNMDDEPILQLQIHEVDADGRPAIVLDSIRLTYDEARHAHALLGRFIRILENATQSDPGPVPLDEVPLVLHPSPPVDGVPL